MVKNIRDFEIGSSVYRKTTGSIYEVISYSKKTVWGYRGSGRARPCCLGKKICGASGKPATTKEQKYSVQLLAHEIVQVTEANFEQLIDDKILKLRAAMTKIKPLLKLQDRIKN